MPGLRYGKDAAVDREDRLACLHRYARGVCLTGHAREGAMRLAVRRRCVRPGQEGPDDRDRLWKSADRSFRESRMSADRAGMP